MCVFFVKQKTAYEMRISDWSSDVCSSDLAAPLIDAILAALLARRDELHLRLGIVGGEQIDLARLVIARRDHDIIVGGGLADADAEADVGLLVRSEEHTSELPSLMRTSFAVCCLKKTHPKTYYKLVCLW